MERYYHHFTVPELTELFEQAGFTVERVEYQTGQAWSDDKQGRNLVAMAVKPVLK